MRTVNSMSSVSTLVSFSLLLRVVETKLAPVKGTNRGQFLLSLALNKLLSVRLKSVRISRQFLLPVQA